jgi:hypothetical protein
MSYVRSTAEYAAVAEFYGGRRAARSGMAYMQHINEGLVILDAIDASVVAKLAFCLHPLAQSDDDLPAFDPHLASTPEVLVATIEYRNVANRCLSHHTGVRPHLSPLAAVNEMLVADKVQNRKDYAAEAERTGSHRPELAAYFDAWLGVLGVTPARYDELAGLITHHDGEDALDLVWGYVNGGGDHQHQTRPASPAPLGGGLSRPRAPGR